MKRTYKKSHVVSVSKHYNILIENNNDPVYDNIKLCEYMDKWDGKEFIDEMKLTKEKSVLEIGAGTGRLAYKTAPLCKSFTGIDISFKTIKRAKQNLSNFKNVTLINADFMSYNFSELYDVIYSTLTFMHIKDKLAAINKIAGLLKPQGSFVLSIDKNKNDFIDDGFSRVKVYPDEPKEICGYIKSSGLFLEKQFETEFAHIFCTKKI